MNATPPVAKLLGLHEAARRAGCPKQTVKKATSKGLLPYFQHGRRRLVRERDLDSWIRSRRPRSVLEEAQGAVEATERAAKLMGEDDRT